VCICVDKFKLSCKVLDIQEFMSCRVYKIAVFTGGKEKKDEAGTIGIT
jgi:hypothetical protein